MYTGPSIIRNGLVLALDAANVKSYSSGSTVWNDLSGNNLTGSLVNGPTFNSTNGGSIVFDGSNDLVYIPVSINTGIDFTVESTAKCNTMTTDGTNRQTVWSFNDGTNAGYQFLDFEVWGDSGRSFNGDGINFTGPASIGSSIQSNNIHSYSLSCRSGIFYWYIDSNFITSYARTYSATSIYYKLASRGGGATGGGQQWNGLIYNTRIYNRGLSATEILQNYNATKARFGL